MQPYTVKFIEDPDFWATLNKFPQKGEDYPKVLHLAGVASFIVAPAAILQCYNDFKDPMKAMHFTVPATPSAITTVMYLVAPQVGNVQRVFAAFFYADGQAILGECSLFPLIHQPLGLRIVSGANGTINRTFAVSTTILKGDEAPIQQTLSSPNNPLVGVTFSEKMVEDTARLDIMLRAPGLATMGVNCGLMML